MYTEFIKCVLSKIIILAFSQEKEIASLPHLTNINDLYTVIINIFDYLLLILLL